MILLYLKFLKKPQLLLEQLLELYLLTQLLIVFK